MVDFRAELDRVRNRQGADHPRRGDPRAVVQTYATDAAAAPIRRAFTVVTLDTPFDGVPNWAIRKTFPDMTGRPERQSQCDALAPRSPQLDRLRARRGALAQSCQRWYAYSAGGDSAVQVPWESGDLFGDSGSLAPWGSAPAYAHYIMPGVSHAGDNTIHDDPYVMASVFSQLLS